MIPHYYRFSTIQKCADTLSDSMEYFVSLTEGQSPVDVTPQVLLEAFADVQRRYEYLKSTMTNVEQSLAAGHDPHRSLVTPDYLTPELMIDSMDSETISSYPF